MDQQAPSTDRAVVEARGLTCIYESRNGHRVHALRGVDVAIPAGTFTAIMGPSGSGKTTLLHCLAGLQRPTAGSAHLGGRSIADLDERRLAQLRRTSVGFVFQAFNLLSALTVAENVELPLRLDGARPARSATRALLARVGLADRETHRPAQLSGGQQQRVSVARALIADPAVVFADEPTGALDIGSARSVLRLLRELADGGQTIVMVTHDPTAAAFADEVLFLADGSIVDRLPRPTAIDIAGRMATLLDAAERANAGTAR